MFPFLHTLPDKTTGYVHSPVLVFFTQETQRVGYRANSACGHTALIRLAIIYSSLRNTSGVVCHQCHSLFPERLS